ncbi:MAG: hypothetical protein OEV64_02885 [Desulfobulbaceae bacterium]|nr:hypothetical protein [Desulfobulbaceae bacterium]
MREREKYENGILTIRFIGDGMDRHGANIYDLSHSLLAVQRIVHKAHLSMEDRLTKGAFPTKEERQILSLQLGERKRASDAFALVSVLSDPVVQQYMKKVVDYVFAGIAGYYVGDVMKRVHKEKDQNKQIYIGSIYTEVANITNRVGAVGEVEAISLGSPVLERETIATFDQDTKEYLAELKNEIILGNYQEIKGRVYKLYPSSQIVAIRRGGGGTVSVFLSEENFEKIRYHKEKSPLFLFKGRPRYQFGVETKAVSEFEADEIEYLFVDS